MQRSDNAHLDGGSPEGRPSYEPGWVLVVDDEVSIAEAVALLVEEAGYHAMQANKGTEALAAMRSHWPSLAIFDYMMPVMNGEKLLAELRRIAQDLDLPMPPVVLMSAAGKEAIAHVAVDVFLGKPFDLAAVEEILDRFLGNAHGE